MLQYENRRSAVSYVTAVKMEGVCSVEMSIATYHRSKRSPPKNGAQCEHSPATGRATDLCGCSGTESANAKVTYWPIVPALDDR